MMDDWDQETLEKVVESKKTEYKQNKPTDIVSFVCDIVYMVSKLICLLNLSDGHFTIFLFIFGAWGQAFLPTVLGKLGISGEYWWLGSIIARY